MADVAIWRLNPWIGGTETSLVELAAFLDSIGHCVTVYGPLDGQIAPLARALGVTITPEAHILNSNHDVLFWYDSFKVFSETLPPAYREAMCRARQRIMVFGGYVKGLRCPFIDRAIAKSAPLAAWLRGLGGIRDVKVSQFPIDLDYWSPPRPGPQQENGALPVLGYVGRLEQKNVGQLVDIAHQVGGTRVRLVVSGRCATESTQGFIDRGCEVFPATVPARPAYEDLDIFGMTSLREGLPRSIMEAMAMGIPTLVWAIGGIPALDPAFAFAPGSLSAARYALRALVFDEAFRREAGKINRRRIEAFNSYVCADLKSWVESLS